MKKIILLTMMALLTISLVQAVPLGTIVTQEDIDAIDFDSRDLQDHFIRKANNKVYHEISGSSVIVYVNMTTIEKNYVENTSCEYLRPCLKYYWDGDYVVINKKSQIKTNYYKLLLSVISNGREETIANLKDKLIRRRESIVEEEKERLKKFQNTDTLKVTSLFEDMEI